MMAVWLTASFDYYLINFLVNTFSKVYLTAFFSSLSEIIAYLFGGILYYKLGLKASIASLYIFSGIAGMFILFWGL